MSMGQIYTEMREGVNERFNIALFGEMSDNDGSLSVIQKFERIHHSANGF